MKTFIRFLFICCVLLMPGIPTQYKALAERRSTETHVFPHHRESSLLMAPPDAGTNSLSIDKEIDQHGGCGIMEILPFIVLGVFVLALMSSCKAPPTAIRAGTQLNIIFCIEYLHQIIAGLVHLNPWGELLFNTAMMACILPVHFYLYSACSNFLLIHPLLPAIKTGLVALCRSVFRV